MAKMKSRGNITSQRAKRLQGERLGRSAARLPSAVNALSLKASGVFERLTVHRSKMVHTRDDRGPVRNSGWSLLLLPTHREVVAAAFRISALVPPISFGAPQLNEPPAPVRSLLRVCIPQTNQLPTSK